MGYWPFPRSKKSLRNTQFGRPINWYVIWIFGGKVENSFAIIKTFKLIHGPPPLLLALFGRITNAPKGNSNQASCFQNYLYQI